MTDTTGRITKKDHYTHVEVATLYGVSPAVARQMIEGGMIAGWGHKPTGKRKVWIVAHADLMEHVRGSWGNFQYVLDRIDGLSEEEMSLIYRSK